MRIIVTGAAGFIGSHTLDVLLARGHTVLGIDNFRTGNESNLNLAKSQNEFTLQVLDITDERRLSQSFAQFKPEAVVHLAALVSVPESISNPEENFRLNVIGTRAVANASIVSNVRRFVFASSAAVYGFANNRGLNEQDPTLPVSPYGEAKLQSERELLSLASSAQISVRVQRYFNVYGPRQDPRSPYSGVISKFVMALKEDASPKIFGDGEQTRDFIFVRDIAEANLQAATKVDLPSGIANICSGTENTLNNIYSILRSKLNSTRKPEYFPERVGDIRNSCGSPAEAARVLEFRAQTDIQTGLEILLETYEASALLSQRPLQSGG